MTGRNLRKVDGLFLSLKSKKEVNYNDKTTFNQRRKTLRNSISSILDKENPLSTDPIFNKRPEQLSVQEFIELTNRVEAALKNKTDIVYSNDIARKGTNKKE